MKRYKVIGTRRLNVRDRPSMSGNILGTLLPFEIIIAEGRPVQDAAGNRWVRHSRGFSMLLDAEGRNAGAGNPQRAGAHFLLKLS